MSMNRREFVLTGAAASFAAAAQAEPQQGPAVATSGVRPLVISSANGHTYKNGGSQTAVERAFSMITSGRDVLDALIAGVNIVELDPLDTSVGYGGLPNAEGVVQLRLEGAHLPRWEPGAHIDLVLPSGRVRQYSLCGDPEDPGTYTIATRLVEGGHGGSSAGPVVYRYSAIDGRTWIPKRRS